MWILGKIVALNLPNILNNLPSGLVRREPGPSSPLQAAQADAMWNRDESGLQSPEQIAGEWAKWMRVILLGRPVWAPFVTVRNDGDKGTFL